jgi:hypothetical protein
VHAPGLKRVFSGLGGIPFDHEGAVPTAGITSTGVAHRLIDFPAARSHQGGHPSSGRPAIGNSKTGMLATVWQP